MRLLDNVFSVRTDEFDHPQNFEKDWLEAYWAVSNNAAAIDLCGTYFWKIKWRHLGFPLLIKMFQGFSAGSLIRHDTVMLSTILYTSSTGFRAQLAKARQFWRGTKTILLLPHWSSFDLQDEKLTVFAARTNQLAPRQTDSFEIASQALSWYYWE